MAKGSIKVGDTVAITATIRKRVIEDRASVLIPSYNQPHSIVDTSPNISSGQKIELTGEVLRVDDDTVTVGGKDLGITIKRSAVRLVTSQLAPKRKTPEEVARR
jgi:preprotein translocase subunit YajC